MNLEQIFTHLRAQGWLLSMHELANDWWVVTYHLIGSTVMSSHSSYGLVETMIYNISKMEIMVAEHERETAKKEKFFAGFSSAPAAPLQRRI